MVKRSKIEVKMKETWLVPKQSERTIAPLTTLDLPMNVTGKSMSRAMQEHEQYRTAILSGQCSACAWAGQGKEVSRAGQGQKQGRA